MFVLFWLYLHLTFSNWNNDWSNILHIQNETKSDLTFYILKMKSLSTPPKPRCRVWQFPTESLTQSVNMKGLVPFRFSTIFIVIHITTSFQKPHYYDKHSHTEYELGSISFNRSKFFMSKFFVISKLDNH